MRRIIYLYILFIFVITGSYLFHQGEVFGVSKYKHSKNFQMTLDSMYHYGYADCKRQSYCDSEACYFFSNDGWDGWILRRYVK